ncbi:heme ABC exporter ATP-binding protein CcmA [Thioflexithrix psekupsensis]|uniref:Heme ABC exporter, ATP-binding protein CcmA n=1 Tax=Thioflexithrix psekupsensis TaxID=1570016 RepID=A0A251XBV2_9GAMM|nr:heme ABC exporter ATP-binding protein CcmA [Thioflexithrix psekupsensis]OUD16206.1 heme ABC exporter, ATP-binding protein CcmA [Thioflexithrix psekupsensis]
MLNNDLINSKLDPLNPAIHVKHLSKTYGEFKAVKNISFSAQSGQIVGLLGPNGAGKTTTLRLLAGIMAMSAGQIEICGYDISQHLFEVRRRIGFLSGDTQLYRRLSPRENMNYFGLLHQLPPAQLKQRIEQLIEQFEMQSFAHRPVEKLSSGQKQRANIARILVHQPRVLILDEITASLDIISSQFMMDFLKQEKQRGCSILFSTHIMSEAEYLCDHILLLYQGDILDEGSPEQLMQQSQAANLTEAFLHQIKHYSQQGNLP